MRRLLAIILLLGLGQAIWAQSYADCNKAKDICKKQKYTFERAGGEGEDDEEADFVSCFMNGENYGQAEENSTWLVFEIAEGGSLTFTITPLNKTDDMDFVVFKLPADGNCKHKQIVRCMAAGDSGAEVLVSPCMGSTGLKSGEKDTQEDAGCADAGDNTWLAPLRTVKGEKYALLVSNVTSRGPGFTINFGGSCKLPCDEEKEPEPAVAEKPKPAKEEQVKPKPAPPAPEQAVEKDIVKVKNRTIQVKIWDDGIEDGDVISLYIDGTKMVDHLKLKNKPSEYTFELSNRKEHVITVYNDDFGLAEINTAKIWIFDGVKEQTIDLKASRNAAESTVHIEME